FEMNIANAVFLQFCGQSLSIEIGIFPRTGKPPDVCQCLDLERLQHSDKRLYAMSRMAYGIDDASARHVRVPLPVPAKVVPDTKQSNRAMGLWRKFISSVLS